MRSLSLLVCLVACFCSQQIARAQADAETAAGHKADVAAQPATDDAETETAPHEGEHVDGEKGHAGGAHGGDGHHEEYGAKGASKDLAEVRGDLAIFTFVVFLGLMVLLTKFAWGPITEALDTRESTIRQDLADTESAKVKSQKLVAEHEAKLAGAHDESREIVAEARRDAETTKADIMAAADSEAEAARQRATADIEHAKDVALKELFDSMSNRVAGATETVLGRSVTGADHDRLIEEALAQFAEGASTKS